MGEILMLNYLKKGQLLIYTKNNNKSIIVEFIEYTQYISSVTRRFNAEIILHDFDKHDEYHPSYSIPGICEFNFINFKNNDQFGEWKIF